ncbi:addiction module antidote protein [Kumtagia ephedrae]|jgi:probable addiction module antidote protein|uniref:Putative addiction module antidote protein n=1 Tax=Kumtagia ephedrae TaxID=2116701 RepID=A0A2P7S3N8_9HYPH|nr:addiction module antidote protein [Mesorhizobium ephedrae]PSJ57051.1 putative addiction module antidote protein [Mesorhizobium ephedrae]
MPLKTYPFDSSRYLGDDQSQRELLADAMGTGDAVYIAHAVGVVARARGMTSIAEEAGVPREALYAALADDQNPDVNTLLDVLKRLGIKSSTLAAE